MQKLKEKILKRKLKIETARLAHAHKIDPACFLA